MSILNQNLKHYPNQKKKNVAQLWKILIRIVGRSVLTPGKGPLIKLYDTPFYHQTINRKLCYKNEWSSQSSFCESGVCKQKYVKQKILAQEITIKNTFEIVLHIGLYFICEGVFTTRYKFHNFVSNERIFKHAS